jgi:hypothetical protein
MMEYVKGPAPPDRWRWYKNYTQYPLYASEKRSGRPSPDPCDQCKAKEDQNECDLKTRGQACNLAAGSP